MRKRNRSFENNWFERIVSVSLLLVFILVLITGILSFTMLNGIIFTIDDTIRPNRSINMIKDIYNDLMLAENHVKAYNLTGSQSDLENYNGLIESTARKVKDLKAMVKSEKVFAPYADTLEILVEKKFDGLDMLVIIKDAYPVKEAIQDFMLDVSGEIQPQALIDTADYKDLDKMAAKIRKATKAALTEEHTRSELEQEWTAYDRLITDRLRGLIASLDSKTARYIKEHTDTVEKQASKVRSIILTFGIASAILLVLTGIVIFLYIRRNNEYRKILKKAKADAEELARARQQFLANMSHEIRTPMNIISGYLDQILKNPLDPELGAQLMIVRKSSDHLLELLNNLLDLSRLQANKLELIQAEFSPGEIVLDMQRWFTPSAHEKNLQLRVEIDPGIPEKLTGDPVRLRQIMFNLISNAVKYTDTGSVTVKAIKSDDRRVVFEVTDTGAGISGDDMDRIFSEFTRGAIALRKSEGSGLGLNITSKIVELMGGKLDVSSAPGKGSTFRVEIPFMPAYEQEESGDPGLPQDSSQLLGLRVLVVDDDSYNLSLVKMILGKYHCQVTDCSSGQEAIDFARNNDLDLVLMDMRMPGISGPAAAHEIRRIFSGRGKEVPVIALSAAITAEDKELLSKAGITNWISKPFEENQLVSVILNLTKGKDRNSLPAVDLDALRKSCDGNTAFFKEMVDLFLQNTDAGLKEIDVKMDAGQWEEVAAIAHRISASCKHLRAERLYGLLKEAENQATKGPDHFEGVTIDQAREEFELIKKSILSEPEFKTS